MAHGEDQTTVIEGWTGRLLSGDESARAALIEAALVRLTNLARKMLGSYPGVRRWEQTDDVLQNAFIRLDRAMRVVTPPTARDFFRQAAVQIRSELIDLARHYYGPEGLGAHHASHDGGPTSPDEGRPFEPSDTTRAPDRLASWTEFHRQVEALPEEEREVFELLWYQGMTQAQAAHVLAVSGRIVNRRWLAARLRLSRTLDDQIPV